MVRFSALVQRRGRITCLEIPDEARNELLPFASKGRIRVAGRLGGTDFSATLMPVIPTGHLMRLPAGLRAASGVRAGDVVSVEVRPQAAQQVTPPGDLASSLHNDPAAAPKWRVLPAPQRRDLIRYIDDARSAAVRERRIQQVVTQVVGGTVLPPGRRGGGPLWTCPLCGQQFVTRNMNHSCGVHSMDEPFRGKPAGIRRLFDAVRSAVEAIGPVTLVPYRDRINFMVLVRFCGARPAAKWLDVDFWLTRRIDSPRFRKVETLTPYTHLYTVRIADASEVDAELAGWLREAYDVGCRRHLRTG